MEKKPTDDLDIPAFLKKPGAVPEEPAKEPETSAPEGTEPSDDRLVGEIVPPPPEGEGTPVFHAADEATLKEFPPEPPLVLPGEAVQGAVLGGVDHTAQPGNMRSGVFPHAPQEITQRIKSAPPNIVEIAPAEPPPAPRFEDLPERTRLELEAGRKAVGGRGPSLSAAVASMPTPEPSSNRPEQKAAPEAEPSWDDLPERTRLELQAGAETLRRKDADYRAVQEKIKAQDAQRLADGAPVKAGDLDYPAG